MYSVSSFTITLNFSIFVDAVVDLSTSLDSDGSIMRSAEIDK